MRCSVVNGQPGHAGDARAEARAYDRRDRRGPVQSIRLCTGTDVDQTTVAIVRTVNFNPSWLMRPGRARIQDPESRTRNVTCPSPVELRVVEEIERLEPELQPHVAAGLEVLEQREIEVVDAGAAQDVASGVAELPESRLREGGRVEPLFDALVESDVRIADEVGAIGTERVVQSAEIRGLNRDRETAAARCRCRSPASRRRSRS